MKKVIEVNPVTKRKRVVSVVEGVSKTDPSFGPECEARNIVERFSKTGQISHLARRPGFYGDVSSVDDLLSIYEGKRLAESEFSKLPARVRDRFSNSIEEYIRFLDDPFNDKEAVELGLKVMSTPQISEEKSEETSGKP